MRLSHVILRVSDLGRSVGFWRDEVGLELAWSGESFAFFSAGGVDLTLNQPEVFEPVGGDSEIVFEVDDIHDTFRSMSSRGVRFEVEPRPVTSDGSRTLYAAHFRDPDGHLASITAWVED